MIRVQASQDIINSRMDDLNRSAVEGRRYFRDGLDVAVVEADGSAEVICFNNWEELALSINQEIIENQLHRDSLEQESE